jgi:L-ascorbate metabolism protein UlaG (beta-lactamase superfamily)
VRLTHIGGPTVLLELDGWRLLTDPTFDPPGRRYAFGWGTSSRKLTGPAIGVDEIGRIDAVLLTHDHHGDNLDNLGQQLLPSAGTVITTVAGSRRVGAGAGLAPWKRTVLRAPGRPDLQVTATPCRHGPPLSRPLAGNVIGFALRVEDTHSVVWVSGDTVMFRGIREVARRLPVDIALLHLGGVQFPITGPVRYSMTAAQAVEALRLVRPRIAVPVHYEGWQHFRQGRAAVEASLADAPDVRDTVRWLDIGTATELPLAAGQPTPIVRDETNIDGQTNAEADEYEDQP